MTLLLSATDVDRKAAVKHFQFFTLFNRSQPIFLLLKLLNFSATAIFYDR